MTTQPVSNTSAEAKAIEFTVDAEPCTTTEREMTAAEILTRVGKSFPGYYLVEIKGQRERVSYKDPGETVHVHPGSKFVSVSTGPTPVS